jgi:death-on-curing protein
MGARDEPVWLLPSAVSAMHQRLLAEHGGLAGVRDPGGLESALARPRQVHAHEDPPPDLAALAAAYAVGFVRNHPFVDGNKRVGFAAAVTFLRLNGANLNAPQPQAYTAMIGLATRELSEAEFAAWLRAHLGAWPARQ